MTPTKNTKILKLNRTSNKLFIFIHPISCSSWIKYITLQKSWEIRRWKVCLLNLESCKYVSIFRKTSDVDADLAKYNIDEFYGIELEEQHIKPIPKEDKLAHLPFSSERKFIRRWCILYLNFCIMLSASSFIFCKALWYRPVIIIRPNHVDAG